MLDRFAFVFFTLTGAFFIAPFASMPFTVAAWLCGIKLAPPVALALGFVAGLELARRAVRECME